MMSFYRQRTQHSRQSEPGPTAVHPGFCHEMAGATYDLAERCDDATFIRAYLDIAARWLQLAHEAKPATTAHPPEFRAGPAAGSSVMPLEEAAVARRRLSPIGGDS